MQRGWGDWQDAKDRKYGSAHQLERGCWFLSIPLWLSLLGAKNGHRAKKKNVERPRLEDPAS